VRHSILAFGFMLVAANLAAQGPPPGQPDFTRNLYPPELVMQHQAEIGFQDSQRSALTFRRSTGAIQVH